MSSNSLTTTPVQEIRPRQSISTGLRSPGLLASQPMIGLAMFIIGVLVFAGLAINLKMQGPLIKWDQYLASTLPAIGLSSPHYVELIINAGFYLGKEVIMVIDVLLAIYFIRKKYWQEFAMVTIGWLGSALIFFILSHIFLRARPTNMIWIIVKIPGFPSGHAIATVTFYLLLAYLLIPRAQTFFGKAAVALVSLLIILFIGFSRIFTGGHYLTDILAGYAVGIAWSGMAYTLIELYFQRRKRVLRKEGI
ncbi:MAG TPA: phosphatase PAP2 family protein [Anaerolineales bacterium]|jgi:membrane-associated phospholipid phosphatase